jgi:hypothetical protein
MAVTGDRATGRASDLRVRRIIEAPTPSATPPQSNFLKSDWLIFSSGKVRDGHLPALPRDPDSASKRRQLTKEKAVKMQSKWDLVPRAWSFRTYDESLPLVSVKMGTLFFLLEIPEACKFAAEIIAAADAAEATVDEAAGA